MQIFFLIFGGLVLLLSGGEVLIRGAVALAKQLGISTLVISLTVVALGTSAPEMLVSFQAAYSGHPDIAVGNIIGSNISNIFLVLGLSALIFPIVVQPRLIHFDGPVMLFLTFLLAFFAWSSAIISSIEGGVLVLCLLLYSYWILVKEKKDVQSAEQKEMEEEIAEISLSTWSAILFTIAGIGLLIVGADILVKGASQLARAMGISESIIGLTIVAVGSSAPEIATCAVAAYRKHSDIALGNVIGSNVLNILAGIGIIAIFVPLPIADTFLEFDLWALIAISVTLLLLMTIKKTIPRIAGGLFFLGYIAYILSKFIDIYEVTG